MGTPSFRETPTLRSIAEIALANRKKAEKSVFSIRQKVAPSQGMEKGLLKIERTKRECHRKQSASLFGRGTKRECC
jgi:hypothetical protein